MEDDARVFGRVVWGGVIYLRPFSLFLQIDDEFRETDCLSAFAKWKTLSLRHYKVAFGGVESIEAFSETTTQLG